MKKLLGAFLAVAFLAAMAMTASAQQAGQSGSNGSADQTSALGQKIMGYDVAPGTGQDGSGANLNSDPSNLGPTGTGLGIYKGMVFGEFDKVANGEEFACDFGSIGVWVCNGIGSAYWHQISGANPDSIISGHFKTATYDEIIGDFGPLGLWLWEPGATAFPGTWTQLSGVNPVWEFAADDDGDTYQELWVNFGAVGLWHYDDSMGWSEVSGLNANYGMRMDSIVSGWEEGCCVFSSGVWRIWSNGPTSTSFTYEHPTGTVPGNDNASAKFMGGTAEDLVMDFGTLGIWLMENQGAWPWHQISTDDAWRLGVAHLGADNPGLIILDNYKTGLWYWHYSSTFPGIEVQINATTPDPVGFVEPFDYNAGDGDDELAVDMGTNGLYVYEYYGGIWTQLSAQNPVCFVAGNWLNSGTNNCLLVNFGTLGLWLYEAPSKTWFQLSSHSPDYSIAS